MKRYKLLKDLPYAKAGEIFELEAGIRRGFAEGVLTNEKREDTKIWTKDIAPIKFGEWFEELPEIKLPERFFYVSDGGINYIDKDYYFWDKKSKKGYQKKIDNCKSINNYFETQKEAAKYFEYLRVKAVIKESAKGFKPDWNDHNQRKFYGAWAIEEKMLCVCSTESLQYTTICFKTGKDLTESFKKHPEEWKTYLTYEQ